MNLSTEAKKLKSGNKLICSECKAETDQGSKYCSNCGVRFSSERKAGAKAFVDTEGYTRCSNCRQRITDDVEVCPRCGEVIEHGIETVRQRLNSYAAHKRGFEKQKRYPSRGHILLIILIIGAAFFLFIKTRNQSQTSFNSIKAGSNSYNGENSISINCLSDREKKAVPIILKGIKDFLPEISIPLLLNEKECSEIIEAICLEYPEIIQLDKDKQIVVEIHLINGIPMNKKLKLTYKYDRETYKGQLAQMEEIREKMIALHKDKSKEEKIKAVEIYLDNIITENIHKEGHGDASKALLNNDGIGCSRFFAEKYLLDGLEVESQLERSGTEIKINY